MQDSQIPLKSSLISPEPKTPAIQFRMPPAPRSLKKQDLRTEFSIDTSTQTDAVRPRIEIKNIEPTRKRSDSTLLIIILFVLTIVTCALGATVFFS